LKKVGHKISDLAQLATSQGLSLAPEHLAILEHMQDFEVALESRYIVTGFKSQPTYESFSDIAEYLDRSVCAALTQRGVPVRAETFERAVTSALPQPSEMLDADGERVLAHLFRAREIKDRSVRMMAHRLQVDQGMLQYHLDQLDELDFAVLSRSSDEDDYWLNTPEGRKYVVQNKLHQAIKDIQRSIPSHHFQCQLDVCGCCDPRRYGA
jgi:hypothetical protein